MLRLAVMMGIMPEAFWRLSLREWRWLSAPSQGEALGRNMLQQMMQQFPDEVGHG